MTRTCALLLLLLLAPLATAQTIYVWTDEDGNKHFSDRKPMVDDFTEQTIDEDGLSTYRAPEVEAPAARRAEPADASRSDSERSPSPSPAAQRAELRRHCDGLQARLDAVQDQLRRGYREPRGQQLRDQRRALRGAYRRDCV